MFFFMFFRIVIWRRWSWVWFRSSLQQLLHSSWTKLEGRSFWSSQVFLVKCNILHNTFHFSIFEHANLNATTIKSLFIVIYLRSTLKVVKVQKHGLCFLAYGMRLFNQFSSLLGTRQDCQVMTLFSHSLSRYRHGDQHHCIRHLLLPDGSNSQPHLLKPHDAADFWRTPCWPELAGPGQHGCLHLGWALIMKILSQFVIISQKEHCKAQPRMRKSIFERCYEILSVLNNNPFPKQT